MKHSIMVLWKMNCAKNSRLTWRFKTNGMRTRILRCDLWKHHNHQAGASCQIINNLSSGRIFIPCAIITLSLSPYQLNAWLESVSPCAIPNELGNNKKKQHVMKLTEEIWTRTYRSHVDRKEGDGTFAEFGFYMCLSKWLRYLLANAI